ncbi:hypothetical protein FACS189485_13750 [Spirochaetia bacterium]|nr:hypothetical protein FACS189485_13750 [Spirochaetia bacterium]
MSNKPEGADFLDSLLLRFHVTLKDIAECDSNHHGEIEDMERIFNLETAEDVRRLLTVPRLLDPLAADDIIEYLREEEKNNPAIKTAEGDFEVYKKLLAAAFVFNPVFFATAWNWCASVRQELQKQKRPPFEIVVFGERAFHSYENPFIEYKAASGAGSVWMDFGEYQAPHLGLIKVFCLDAGSYRYLMFTFSPEVPVLEKLLQPYKIEVEFAARDNTIYTLSALDEWGGSGVRESERGENIDYTLGLTLKKIWIGSLGEST